MDLEFWRDLTFVIFASLLLLVLLIFIVVSAVGSFLVVKVLSAGRGKLAEVKPKIAMVRETASKVEVGVEKGADAVSAPFIKARGLVNGIRRGATTLFTGRDAGG
ncbi:MAG: hypothetical protein WEB00_06675 [Dehalococcoidia bacterium]